MEIVIRSVILHSNLFLGSAGNQERLRLEVPGISTLTADNIEQLIVINGARPCVMAACINRLIQRPCGCIITNRVVIVTIGNNTDGIVSHFGFISIYLDQLIKDVHLIAVEVGQILPMILGIIHFDGLETIAVILIAIRIVCVAVLIIGRLTEVTIRAGNGFLVLKAKDNIFVL